MLSDPCFISNQLLRALATGSPGYVHRVPPAAPHLPAAAGPPSRAAAARRGGGAGTRSAAPDKEGPYLNCICMRTHVLEVKCLKTLFV